jgi:hypothetical protein
MQNAKLSTALTKLSEILNAAKKGNALLEKTRKTVSTDLQALFPALVETLPLLHAEQQQIPADISALILALPAEQLEALKKAKSADKHCRLSNILKFDAEAVILRLEKSADTIGKVCQAVVNPFEHGLKITVATPEKPAKSDADKLYSLLHGLKKAHNLTAELPDFINVEEFKTHVAYLVDVAEKLKAAHA